RIESARALIERALDDAGPLQRQEEMPAVEVRQFMPDDSHEGRLVFGERQEPLKEEDRSAGKGAGVDPRRIDQTDGDLLIALCVLHERADRFDKLLEIVDVFSFSHGAKALRLQLCQKGFNLRLTELALLFDGDLDLFERAVFIGGRLAEQPFKEFLR